MGIVPPKAFQCHNEFLYPEESSFNSSHTIDLLQLQQNLRSKSLLNDRHILEFSSQDALSMSMVDRFSEVVKRFPDNTAIKSPECDLTYVELDRVTNAVAHLLLEKRDHHSGTIGILSEHSAQSFIANIGILKAGCIRVDLNVSFPLTRLQAIIESCGIRCIITRTRHFELARQLADQGMEVIDIDKLDGQEDPGHPGIPIAPTNTSSINFTSGSTGTPKKTFKNHRIEIHSCMRVPRSIGLHSTDRMLYPRSSSVIPFHAMLHGATYFPYDIQVNGDLDDLTDWIRKEEITIFRAPVSIFRALANSLSGPDSLPSVRLIVLQGEPVFRADVELYKQHFTDDCILVSTLGVSELGDFAHFFVDKETRFDTPTVPGGFTLQDVEIVIEEDDKTTGRPVGEIGVTGPFMSQSPIVETDYKTTATVYPTGDLGSIGDDGCLYHHGRKDFQIKVRGNRVNLQELEAALLDLNGISQAAAVGQTDEEGNVTLLAYLETPSVDQQLIRGQLSKKLPAYMVPTYIIAVPNMPRTLKGKINKRELPPPELEIIQDAEAADESCSETTREVITIWKEILRQDHVGPHDDFLDKGGDSLKSMRVLARINQNFNIKLPLRVLFDAQTPTEVAEAIESYLA